MNVVERQLIALIGEKAARKILDHPNLHVLSLPPNIVQDLEEGTVMVVPVGKLCDLCDLPEANKFCQCEHETIENADGFTMTVKHRKGEHSDRAAQIRRDFLGTALPPAYQYNDDRVLLRPEDDRDNGAEQPGSLQGGGPVERGDVEGGSVSSVQGWSVEPSPQESPSVGEASSGSGGFQDSGSSSGYSDSGSSSSYDSGVSSDGGSSSGSGGGDW